MSTPMPMQKTKAISLVLLASFASALMSLFVKLAANSLPIFFILFVRFFISWLLCLCLVKYQKPAKQSFIQALYSPQWRLQITRAIIGSLSLLAFFNATKYLSLASANVLFATSPFFIPLIAYLWRNIRFYHHLWWAMLLGFAGIVIMLHPGKDLFSWPACWAIVAGFGAAVVIFSSRLLSYNEPEFRTVFYDFSVGVLFSLLLLITHQTPVHINLLNSIYVLMVGISGFLYLYFSVASTYYAPVRLTGPFIYATTIFSLFFDWWLWQHVPDFRSWLGITCIVIAGILMLALYPNDRYQTHS